jgi:hypothetical protein
MPAKRGKVCLAGNGIGDPQQLTFKATAKGRV